jgi:hypothetical protein
MISYVRYLMKNKAENLLGIKEAAISPAVIAVACAIWVWWD